MSKWLDENQENPNKIQKKKEKGKS